MWSEFSKILRNSICLFKQQLCSLWYFWVILSLEFYQFCSLHIAEEFFETNSIVVPKVDSHFYLDLSSLALIFFIPLYFSLALTLLSFPLCHQFKLPVFPPSLEIDYLSHFTPFRSNMLLLFTSLKTKTVDMDMRKEWARLDWVLSLFGFLYVLSRFCRTSEE